MDVYVTVRCHAWLCKVNYLFTTPNPSPVQVYFKQEKKFPKHMKRTNNPTLKRKEINNPSPGNENSLIDNKRRKVNDFGVLVRDKINETKRMMEEQLELLKQQLLEVYESQFKQEVIQQFPSIIASSSIVQNLSSIKKKVTIQELSTPPKEKESTKQPKQIFAQEKSLVSQKNFVNSLVSKQSALNYLEIAINNKDDKARKNFRDAIENLRSTLFSLKCSQNTIEKVPEILAYYLNISLYNLLKYDQNDKQPSLEIIKKFTVKYATCLKKYYHLELKDRLVKAFSDLESDTTSEDKQQLTKLLRHHIFAPYIFESKRAFWYNYQEQTCNLVVKEVLAFLKDTGNSDMKLEQEEYEKVIKAEVAIAEALKCFPIGKNREKILIKVRKEYNEAKGATLLSLINCIAFLYEWVLLGKIVQEAISKPEETTETNQEQQEEGNQSETDLEEEEEVDLNSHYSQ